ncbi:hypothetical protein JAB9_45130 [Janthinobacterium sp. HH107]|nr:hypothetical protein JAB9_45130 [Janthinobacterium sp. HH107]
MLKLLPDGKSTSALTLYVDRLPAATPLWPYSSARLAVPAPRMALLMLMLFCAVRVSLLAVQLMLSLTLMLPCVPLPPDTLWICTLPDFKELLRKAPVMSPPETAILKSVGSISQVPARPLLDAVVTFSASSIFTCAAEVSMKPPLPPSDALASRVPAAFTVPLCMSPSNLIMPPRVAIVCASITPVLLTAVFSKSPAACAVSTTLPPSAWSRPPLLTKAPTAPALTATLSKPSPATSRVIALPAARATEPRRAWIVPSFETCAPSRAT